MLDEYSLFPNFKLTIFVVINHINFKLIFKINNKKIYNYG